MNKIYSLIGIAKKAGKIIAGETGCIQAIKKNQCKLLIIAEDASYNTKDRFINLCNKKDIKFLIFGEKNLLAEAIGKSITATIAINDLNFSSLIINNINHL